MSTGATREQLKKLSKKFPEQDIEWRVQQAAPDGKWVMIIPYITNRAIMQRLDDSVGPGSWKNEFKASPDGTGYMCGISIKIDSEWVTRWDGSSVTGERIDPVKSTMSAAMKRTGVQWGIGRYLYQFDVVFAEVKPCSSRREQMEGWTYQQNKNKQGGWQWKPKPLPSWALPVTEQDIKNYSAAMKNANNEQELKAAFSAAYKLSVAEDDKDLLEKFTKVKDARKQELIDIEEAAKEERLERLADTLHTATQTIKAMSNAAALISQIEQMKQHIIKVTNSTKEEREPYLAELDKAIEAKLKTFKGK